MVIIWLKVCLKAGEEEVVLGLDGRLSLGGLPKAWSRSSIEGCSFVLIRLQRTNTLGEGAHCSVVPLCVCCVEDLLNV